MGKRTFPSILLLAALLLVVLQHAVTTAVPLRGPAAKPMKLSPGKLLERVSRVLVPSAGAAEPSSPSKKDDKKEKDGPTPTTAQLFITGMLSGAAAGMSVDLTLFPLDTIKTRLQASNSKELLASGKLFQGVYDGVGPALVASAPACAAFFGAYDTLKRYLSLHIASAPLVNLLAAAGGDLTQSVVRVPFEVVKQRLQAGVDKTWQGAVSSIMASRGPKGFYVGWAALALRDLPFDIIEFPLYEALKELWSRRKGGKSLEAWEASLCGSLAGGIAAGLTTPLDVVKTRLMTQTSGSGVQYKGLLDCLLTVARDEGPSALFRGIGPRIINIALGGAIFFGAYEAARKVVEPAVMDKGQGVKQWWASLRQRAGHMRELQMSRGLAPTPVLKNKKHHHSHST